jgi:ferredoxin
MTYYVNEKCQGCKYSDCVLVCPVDCFYEDKDAKMLVIDPSACIDCGVCVPECPVDAIKSDCDEDESIEDLTKWLLYNAEQSKIKDKNITTRQVPLKPYPINWKK